jgi:hypothetical protein
VDGQAILVVSGAVVALTQLVKWMGLADQRAPIAVLGLSLMGVIFWGWSHEETFMRTQAFAYFAGWIAVATSAAGVYGFTRSAPASIAEFKEKPPPSRLIRFDETEVVSTIADAIRSGELASPTPPVPPTEALLLEPATPTGAGASKTDKM